MKKIIFTILLVCAQWASADVMKDFDGLGENKDLFDTAKALHPDLNVTVVQQRVVDRRMRFEVAPELSAFTGGDAYMDTAAYGLTTQLHIVPWVSVGARYTKFSNEPNDEAKNLINNGFVPDMDYPEDAWMGFVNFYPIYGKMNTMNIGITHFDLYLSLGYGNINLRSGGTNTWSAGGGVGLWWSQHFSTRLEVRYQTYEAQRFDQGVNIDSTVASLQLGYLL